jgi:dihydrofolate reductase
MRKIINSAFVSLDGVTEDPNSWATFDPDSGDEAAQALQALDGMLMGRGTYEYFADVMIIRDDVVAAVTKLKQEDGGDLMMYGYGRLSRTVLEHHLVDEIRFSVHPVLVGQTLPLKLIGATPSPSGVVALTYEPTSS